MKWNGKRISRESQRNGQRKKTKKQNIFLMVSQYHKYLVPLHQKEEVLLDFKYEQYKNARIVSALSLINETL